MAKYKKSYADKFMDGFMRSMIPASPIEEACAMAATNRSDLDLKKEKIQLAKQLKDADPTITTIEDAIKLIDAM